MLNDITFRPATSEDAELFYGRAPRFSFKGFVAEYHGDVVGLGGIYYHGDLPVAFTDMAAPMRRDRKACARACRLLTQYFDATGHPVYAVPAPTSAKLLAKLGFRQTGRNTPIGELLMRTP
jgi:hypothetical protein